MKLARKILALALTLCLMLPLTGCGEVVGRYRIVETLGEQSYAIGFRNDDYVRYYVEAALQELAADGTISGLANSWFIEDNTYFVSRSNALAQFAGIPSRTLLVGADGQPWGGSGDAASAELSGSTIRVTDASGATSETAFE